MSWRAWDSLAFFFIRNIIPDNPPNFIPLKPRHLNPVLRSFLQHPWHLSYLEESIYASFQSREDRGSSFFHLFLSLRHYHFPPHSPSLSAFLPSTTSAMLGFHDRYISLLFQEDLGSEDNLSIFSFVRHNLVLICHFSNKL